MENLHRDSLGWPKCVTVTSVLCIAWSAHKNTNWEEWDRDKGKRSVRWQHLYLFCLKQPSLPRTRLRFQSPRRHQPRLLRGSPHLSQCSGWARKHDFRQLEWQRPEGMGSICFNTSNLSSAHSCRRGRERHWTDQSRSVMKRGRWSGTWCSSLFPQTGDYVETSCFQGLQFGDCLQSLPKLWLPKWFDRNVRKPGGSRERREIFVALQMCNFYHSFGLGSTGTGHPCGTQVTRKHNEQQVLSSKGGPLSRTCELLGCIYAESCLFFQGREKRKSKRLLCQVSL